MDVGLDRLGSVPSLVARLQAARVGVLAHPASVTRELVHIARTLETVGVRPAVLFGPEHGWGGEAQDIVGVPGAIDPGSGAPIVSLYGDRFDDLSPTAEHLAAIDLLLI